MGNWLKIFIFACYAKINKEDYDDVAYVDEFKVVLLW